MGDRLFCTGNGEVKPPITESQGKRVLVGRIRDREGRTMDEAVLLVFRGPASFTTEDVIEFQCHGSPAVLRAVLAECLALGARLAAPGEFTKRAFLGGRLDLAQAEAVGDLVSAQSERALSAALAQLDGQLSRAVADLRSQVLDLLAALEASLDYPDELGDGPILLAAAELEHLGGRLAALLASAPTGRMLREGMHVAIVGRPNVGKSSLLNALLREDRAIVTPIPGTTRDLIEEGLELAGVPLRLVDTAGIRSEAADEVEREGIARSRARMARSDLRLVVLDGETGVLPEDRAILAEAGESPCIAVINKIDRLRAGPVSTLGSDWRWPVAAVSARTGEGLEALQQAILVQALGPEAGVSAVAVNARHAACLERAAEALGKAREALGHGVAADLVAIDVREAVLALSELTGAGVGEELLDRLFSRFCVGK